MNKESFINKIKNTFDKYDGSDINSIVSKIKDDLQLCLNNYLCEHVVYETDFPIEFNNDFGRWRIEANGDSFLIPRKPISKFECNIVILPGSDIL